MSLSQLRWDLQKIEESFKRPAIEPAGSVGVATSSLAALFVVINFFFPNLLSEDVQNAILVLGAIILPMISAFIIRGKVWSPASVIAIVSDSVKRTEEIFMKERNREKLSLKPTGYIKSSIPRQRDPFESIKETEETDKPPFNE